MSGQKQRKRLDNFLLVTEQGDTNECVDRLGSLFKRSPDYRYQISSFEEFLAMKSTEEFDGIFLVFEDDVDDEMIQRIRTTMKERSRPLFLAFLPGVNTMGDASFEVPEVPMKRCQCLDRVGFFWRKNTILEDMVIQLWVDFMDLRNQYFRLHSAFRN